MAQQAAAAVAVHLNAAELRALHVVDAIEFHAIVLGEPFVHEGEVGGEEVQDVAVFLEHGLEEQLGFLAHRAPELFVELGE